MVVDNRFRVEAVDLVVEDLTVYLEELEHLDKVIMVVDPLVQLVVEAVAVKTVLVIKHRVQKMLVVLVVLLEQVQ